jgi:hypothetical protein
MKDAKEKEIELERGIETKKEEKRGEKKKKKKIGLAQ